MASQTLPELGQEQANSTHRRAGPWLQQPCLQTAQPGCAAARRGGITGSRPVSWGLWTRGGGPGDGRPGEGKQAQGERGKLEGEELCGRRNDVRV